VGFSFLVQLVAQKWLLVAKAKQGFFFLSSSFFFHLPLFFFSFTLPFFFSMSNWRSRIILNAHPSASML